MSDIFSELRIHLGPGLYKNLPYISPKHVYYNRDVTINRELFREINVSRASIPCSQRSFVVSNYTIST